MSAKARQGFDLRQYPETLSQLPVVLRLEARSALHADPRLVYARHGTVVSMRNSCDK
jgi:hypothetical protein